MEQACFPQAASRCRLALSLGERACRSLASTSMLLTPTVGHRPGQSQHGSYLPHPKSQGTMFLPNCGEGEESIYFVSFLIFKFYFNMGLAQ